MKRQRIPILVYHHVYEDEAPVLPQRNGESGAGIISESQFLRQMRYLADEGWRVVSTARIVAWLNASGGLPERAVVLHFDNGWLDTFTVSFPTLQRLGMAATCLPITDGVEAATHGEGVSVRNRTGL